MQQTKDTYCIRGPDIYLSIRNRRHDKFVACPKMVASVGCLIAVVELVQIPCIICMEYSGVAVLGRPHDPIARAV